MENLPITLENNEPVISTLDIAEGVEVEHSSIFRLIKKFKSELESIRIIRILNLKNKSKGRPVSYCFLNEEQTIFLVTLMRNFPKVVEFKKQLSRDFMRMRNKLLEIAMQKTDPARIAKREVGKIARKHETDAIKEFIQYAKDQGGTPAGCDMYYSNITARANENLFTTDYKFKNLRDVLNLSQLSTIETADNIISKALKEGMESNLHYKDIYKLAKKRIITFADLHGKTYIPTTQLRLEA